MPQTLIVGLNTDQYEKTVGSLPKAFLRCCVHMVGDNIDLSNGVPTNIKEDAVLTYWKKAGGTGGFKQAEKMNPELFNFLIG